jgi:putative chitinase
MTIIAATTIARMAGTNVNSNIRSVVSGLDQFGHAEGLQRPHRMAQYLAQLIHESARFRYDRELWGPTPAQKRYDTRTDLGNTAARDGDGYKFRGRSPIQLTGHANYEAFTEWAKGLDPNAPDFTEEPDAINTDPWEGAVAIWYWSVGNPERRSLNRYADRGDIEMVTRRINGGLNGYSDRLVAYDRCALILLGRDPEDIRGFQRQADLAVDGVSGPLTRKAMHDKLVAFPDLSAAGDVAEPPKPPVQEVKPTIEDAVAQITAILRALLNGKG